MMKWAALNGDGAPKVIGLWQNLRVSNEPTWLMLDTLYRSKTTGFLGGLSPRKKSQKLKNSVGSSREVRGSNNLTHFKEQDKKAQRPIHLCRRGSDRRVRNGD